MEDKTTDMEKKADNEINIPTKIYPDLSNICRVIGLEDKTIMTNIITNKKSKFTILPWINIKKLWPRRYYENDFKVF